MLLDTLSTKAFTARRLAESGLFAPTRPDRLARVVKALRGWGPTVAGGYAASAIRFPDATAIIDEHGALTLRRAAPPHERARARVERRGDREGDAVAILCRNHRGFVEAVVGGVQARRPRAVSQHGLLGAAARRRLRARGSARDRLRRGVRRLVEAAAAGRQRYVAWTSRARRRRAGATTLEQLVERGDPSEVVPPQAKGRIVVLTSGTTGAPKGANRKEPKTLDPAAALLSKIPLRARGRTLIAAPLFHSWGLAHFVLGIGLSSTLVLRRRFDAGGHAAGDRRARRARRSSSSR